MDVNVPSAIASELRLRGVDVVMARDDGTRDLDDPALLDRVLLLARVLFTNDVDLLREATFRQRRGEPFAGVVYAHQLGITIGQCVDDLELIARVCDLVEWRSRVEYLPLE